MPCVRAERATAPQRIGPGRDNMNGYDHSLLLLLFLVPSLLCLIYITQRFKLAAALLCAPPFHPPATADRGGRVKDLRERPSERSEHCGDRPPRGRHRAGEETARFHCSHNREIHNKAIDRSVSRVCCAARFFWLRPDGFPHQRSSSCGFCRKADTATKRRTHARTYAAHQLCPSHKTRKIPL